MNTAMKTVYLNGNIHTYDETTSTADSFVVEDGKFAFVGTESDIDLGDANVVDLQGKTVIPAFTDAHLHPEGVALLALGLELSSFGDDVAGIQEAIRDYLAKHPDTEIIKGFGWLENCFPGIGPNKKWLDEVTTDIPIALTAESGHTLWLNSKALELAGITEDTVPVEGGIIERNEDGSLRGVVRTETYNQVNQLLPDFTVEEYKDYMKKFLRFWNSMGLLGFFDAWSNLAGDSLIEAYKELVEEGEMTAYFRGSYAIYPFEDIDAKIAEYKQRRGADDLGEAFQINTIKLFNDGAYEVNRSAYLLEPYANNTPEDPDYVSAPLWTQDRLNEVVEKSLQAGFQVHIHCIGDGAVHESVNAFEAAAAKGIPINRSVIVHLESLTDEDIPRIKKLGIIPAIHPIWAERDPWNVYMDDVIGYERSQKLWRIGAMVNEGIECAAATDFPAATLGPSCPLLAIEQAVTRRLAKPSYPMIPDFDEEIHTQQLGDDYERISLDQAVRLYTTGGARTLFSDDYTASISAGKNADFLILDKDIYTIPIEEVSSVQVLSTFMKGKELYSKERDGVIEFPWEG